MWPSGTPTVKPFGKVGRSPPVWIGLPAIVGDVFGIEAVCHNDRDFVIRLENAVDLGVGLENAIDFVLEQDRMRAIDCLGVSSGIE